MTCLGVHFAVPAPVAKRLAASAGDDEALQELVGEIEDEWDAEHLFETDKAWDALHRCLSDGTLDPEGGKAPLNQVFFGGRMLNEGDDYFVVLIGASQVARVAKALAKVTEAGLRARYDRIDPGDYDGEKGAEDWRYTWESFQGLPEFFARAAREKRAVIFTVDQ